jgi:hypothetical protein
METLSAAVRESEARGYRLGFVAGWYNALERFGRTIKQLEAEDLNAVMVAHIERIERMNKGMASSQTVHSSPPSGRAPREGSDQDAVLQLIRQSPGLRGVEIAKRLSDKIQERTVRTALHRLKVRGLIEPREGVWWPKDHDSPYVQKDIDFEGVEGQPAATD